jgi:Zn-dependent protease
MQTREARDLVISAVVLAFVFAYSGIGNISLMFEQFLVALFAVSLGFLLHELSHRFIAKRNKCHAEYRLWTYGLFLAVLLALVTNGSFVFAAPGAVMIYPLVDLWGNPAKITKKEVAMISIAGPLMNMILFAAFFAANLIYPHIIFSLGASVNIWLALFNTLPIPPLDGQKIFSWSKKIWTVFFAVLAVLFVLQFLV